MRALLEKYNLRFNRNEIAGSLGDLGTFLPLVAGLVNRCGMNLGHILFFAGAMHFVSGLTFGIPIPVQPMKSIAAIAIAEGLDEATILAAGIGAGVVLLILVVTGLIDLVSTRLPKAIVRGLQLAIGLKLLIKGIGMVESTGTWIGPDSILTAVIGGIIIVFAAKSTRLPGALIVFTLGIGLLFWINPGITSQLSWGWTLPSLHIPTYENFLTGFWLGTVPQIPLTVLNSVVAVTALSVDLFPERPLRPRKVAVSVALMNLISCPLGGMPMCHGSGGLAAQYRFGARTGGSVVFLGSAKMFLAVVFGGSLLVLIMQYPMSILGIMLAFSGLELAAVCRDQNQRAEFTLMIVTAALAMAVNIAVGFVVGLIISFFIRKKLGLFEFKRPGQQQDDPPSQREVTDVRK